MKRPRRNKSPAHPSTKGGSSSWVVLEVPDVVNDTLHRVMEIAGLGWGLDLESVYSGSNHEETVEILVQAFHNLESREVVLLCCGLYGKCGCGMYVRPDSESA